MQEKPDQTLDIFDQDGASASLVLGNARILLEEGELELAAALFRRAKDHQTMAHCAHFGIGMCLLKAGDPLHALAAFEKAFSLAARPYIARQILRVLFELKEYEAFEEKALAYARTFPNEDAFLEQIKNLYLEISKVSGPLPGQQL